MAFFHNRASQGRRINWWIAEFSQKIGNSAYVVHVSMGKDYRADIFSLGFKIGNVGDDPINARSIFFGKLYAHVDNDDFVFVFKEGHVASDFFKPAQGYEPQGFFGAGRVRWRARSSNRGTRRGGGGVY